MNRQSGKVLDVTGGSSAEAFADQTLIQQWGWSGGLNQQWQLIPTDSGYYEIVNRQSGKVLDVIGGSSDKAYADNTLVQQYTWVDGGNQQWSFVPTDSGYYEIVNRQSGKVLDVRGGSSDQAKADGASIQQYGWVGGANQQWTLVQVPTVSVLNLTHPDLSPNFLAGDTYQFTIQGPPNQVVSYITNSGSWVQVGQTDGNGNFITSGVEQADSAGSYTQIWSVGATQASPTLTFSIAGGQGTLTTTTAAQTPDGSVIGISSLSLGGGNASTYSLTELDYSASLYYTVQTIGTLYQDGVPIQQLNDGEASAAGGVLSSVTNDWSEYTVQTDHYVVAYFFDGVYYDNPFSYSEGSCDEYTSDCTYWPASGAYYLDAALIYLGSTLADQINVPDDPGSFPLVDGAYHDGFLDRNEPHNIWWNLNIKKIIPALILAARAFEQQNPGQSYEFPMALQLIGDSYSTPPNPAGFAERERTYAVRDTRGAVWNFSNPLRIDEQLFHMNGTIGQPPANTEGWSQGNGGLFRQTGFPTAMSDDYSTRSLSAAPDEYVEWEQEYLASQFAVPDSIQIAPMWGYGANTVPLPIFSRNLDGAPGCSYFATQGIRAFRNLIQVNGDGGPPSSDALPCPQFRPY